MKQLKRTLAVLLLLCALVPALPAFAAQALVQDGAGLLSAEEARQLSAQAQAIQDDYGLPVYIVTVPAMNGESDVTPTPPSSTTGRLWHRARPRAASCSCSRCSIATMR